MWKQQKRRDKVKGQKAKKPLDSMKLRAGVLLQ